LIDTISKRVIGVDVLIDAMGRGRAAEIDIVERLQVEARLFARCIGREGCGVGQFP